MALCNGYAAPQGRKVAHAQRCGATPEFDGYCAVHLKLAGYQRCGPCGTWRGVNDKRPCAATSAGGYRPMLCAPRTGARIIIRTEGGLEFEAHWAQWIEDHPPIEPGFYFLKGTIFDLVKHAAEWRPAPPRDTQPLDARAHAGDGDSAAREAASGWGGDDR